MITVDKKAGTVMFSGIDFSKGVEQTNVKTGKKYVIISQVGSRFGLQEHGEYKVGFTLMPNTNSDGKAPKGRVVSL